jgi:hypothetical protein
LLKRIRSRDKDHQGFVLAKMRPPYSHKRQEAGKGQERTKVFS